MAKKQLGIFFIDINKAYFYGSNSASLLQIDIPADTVSYFDVINKDKFYQLIQTLITTHKIMPVPLLILFSPAGTYEKDAEGKTPEEITTSIEQFIDIVPYERVLSRTYKIQEKTKVVAVNKDIYETIKRAFEKLNFQTVAVAALPLLQKLVPDLGTSLNLEVIANKFDAIKQYSLITLDEINNPGRNSQEIADSAKPNPLRLYGLIGVFVVLIGILILMVIKTFQPEKKPVAVKTAVPTAVIVTPTVLPTETPIPTLTPVITGNKTRGLLTPTLSPLPTITTASPTVTP